MSIWPPFDIRIGTPELTLRLPTDAELEALAPRMAGNILPAGDEGFLGVWYRVPSPGLERGLLTFHWTCRADLGPAAWHLPFGVFPAGEDVPVGVQEVNATDFATTGRVGTGSWLLRSAQGRGIGTLMRAMALEFAFRGLGAVEAVTSHALGNHASGGVTARLGYREVAVPDGGATDEVHHLLRRDDWIPRPEVEITGLAESLPMLGAPHTPA